MKSQSTLAFDAAAQFSSDHNPNGTWSYGWSYGVGTTFHLSTSNTQDYAGGLAGWMSGLDVGGYPFLLHNGTAGPLNSSSSTTFWPGELGQQPGASNEVSIVRWTAPFSGTCTVAVYLARMSADVSVVAVHILHNGISIFDDDSLENVMGHNLLGRGEIGDFFTNQVAVVEGDTIDFVVDSEEYGPNENTTGLTATIFPVDAGDADLGINLTGPRVTFANSNVVYSILVTNAGPDMAIDVTVTNTLPPQVINVSYGGGSNGLYKADANGNVIGSFPVLGAGQTSTMTITGTVLCTTTNGDVLTDTATVGSLSPDSLTFNNQASTVATNNAPRKPPCGNTLEYKELYGDRVTCHGSKSKGYSCQELNADRINLTITMSLAGSDTTQFNTNTSFDVRVGGFSFRHALLDDPHYKAGKTQATFHDQITDGGSVSVGSMTAQLKWTQTELTAKIMFKDSDMVGSEDTPVLAGSYDGTIHGVITDQVAASVDLGSVTSLFSRVSSSGTGVTASLAGKNGTTYAISTITLAGTAAH
ncbi:MAG TPA: DUF11 domain-containing protein [Verrucomicrobiae bacterium]|nr:DUF11 domain-containing protein [Verrucomicrobiae bacterium]